MKKAISITIAFVLVIASVLALVSCGISAGTYKSALGDEIEVSGSKITRDYEVASVTIGIVQKYSIKDDEITLEYDSFIYDGDSNTVKGLIEDLEDTFADEFTTTASFEKGDGYIVIGGVKYEKQ